MGDRLTGVNAQMRLGEVRSWNNARRRRLALVGLIAAPLLVAALGLLIKVPADVLYLTGGRIVAWNSFCLVVLAPYIVLAFIGLGSTYVDAGEDSGLDAADVLLLQFFAGAALFVLIGVCFGAARLLYPLVAIPLFVGAAVLFLYRNLPDTIAWKPQSAAGQLLVALIGLSSGVLLLVKGVVLDATRGDIPQLYIPLLADLQNRHTFWLDLVRPKMFWFLLGRGHGNDMLLVSFAGPYAHQVLSIIYLLSVAAIVHRMAARLADGWILPGCAALIAMWSAFIGLETGRFHFEEGAFLLFVAWAGLLLSATETRAVFRALAVAVLAITVMLPQAAILTFAFLVAGAATGWFTKGPRGIIQPLAAAAIGLCVAALSLAVNQLYLGIAEVNPIEAFMPFVNVKRFSQISSMDLMVYVNNAQGIHSVGLSMDQIRAATMRLSDVFSDLFFLKRFWPYPVFILASAALAGSKGSPRNAPFGGGLCLCLLAVAGLIALTSHGSLERVLAFRSVATPLVAVSLIVALAGPLRRLHWWGYHSASPLSATAVVALAAVVAIVGAELQGEITEARLAGALAFVSGRIGLVGTSPTFDVLDPRRCLDVAHYVPAGWRILPVNSALRFLPTCAESPLLPPDRVVDTLHPVFLPDYGDVLLGPAAVSMATLRRYNVNAFYIENNNLDFFAHGQSPVFDPDSLRSNFDVLHVGSDYVLLTWKGLGTPIADAQVTAITALRERSRTTGDNLSIIGTALPR